MVKKKITIDVDVPDGHKRSSKHRKKKKRKLNLKIPFSYRKTYDQYKNKMLDMVTRFFEEELGVIAEGIKDTMSMKRKLRMLTWHWALLFAGMTILLFGVAKYLDCICPQLACGLSFALIGLAAIVISLIYKRVAR